MTPYRFEQIKGAFGTHPNLLCILSGKQKKGGQAPAVWKNGQVSFDLSLFFWNCLNLVSCSSVPVVYACNTWDRHSACTHKVGT